MKNLFSNLSLSFQLIRSGWVLLIVLALTACTAADPKLRPYSSDGCSSFPDGTLKEKNLWLACCQQHDYAYWKGGTRAQRLTADLELKQCVADTGQPEIGALMLPGVRAGGSPYWPTSFRWGYGWRYFRPYGELDPEEIKRVETLTPECVKSGNC